jgi:hypothetical protein
MHAGSIDLYCFPALLLLDSEFLFFLDHALELANNKVNAYTLNKGSSST